MSAWLRARPGRKMLLGVDRLDYSKGIDERLLAYNRLLNESPELKREIFLLQISTARAARSKPTKT
jgi:trehalose 6-phosphate synthase